MFFILMYKKTYLGILNDWPTFIFECQRSYYNRHNEATITCFWNKAHTVCFQIKFCEETIISFKNLLKQDKLIQCDNDNFISETKQYSIETYTYYQRKQLWQNPRIVYVTTNSGLCISIIFRNLIIIFWWSIKNSNVNHHRH